MKLRRPEVWTADSREPGPPPRRPRWPIVAGGVAALLIVVVLLIAVIPGPGPDSDAFADPSWLGEQPTGNIVYCSGKDVSHTQQRSVDDFNSSKDSGTARASIVQLASKADDQRAAYLRQIDARGCDVLYLDIVYTPELAFDHLLYDMSRYLALGNSASTFDPRMMRTVEYDGKKWGVPKQLDGGVLYYRKDQVRPPDTWRRLLIAAKPRPGELPRLRFQLDAYEGLTVAFLEIAYAAGAEDIVSADGKTARIDQPGTLKALRFLLSAIRRGAVPRSVTDQAEKGSLYVFEVGRASYLRSWPYIEASIRRDAKTAQDEGRPMAAEKRRTEEHLGVVSLPPWTLHGPPVGILGGHNLVIPRTAKNPHGALQLIRFLTRPDQILKDARQGSLAPVLDLWDRPEVRASPALRAVEAVELRPRPIIPSYFRVSRVIYTALRRVLRNVQADETLPAELRKLQVEVQAELDR
jgi:multiple sugar transport system substrate-binding protein